LLVVDLRWVQGSAAVGDSDKEHVLGRGALLWNNLGHNRPVPFQNAGEDRHWDLQVAIGRTAHGDIHQMSP